ncbi:kinase-like protein [Schizopora paradoxa]|uniref:Kinase-like protein n=1 Tax=Schizopora paradoxa TaxID=27342 RepID=A0A0H2S6F5_9AGAM|nr:kinase-like protein [Schizopora paradoxa]
MPQIRFSEYGDPSFARLYSDRFPELHVLNRDFTRKYRLGSVLGAGGFGFVMDACDRLTGVVVAVKFLEYGKVPSSGWLCRDIYPSLMDRLKETHVLSRCEHPGIVTLVETFSDNLYIYIVQELHGCPWPSQTYTPSGTPPLEADLSLPPSPSSVEQPLSPLDLPLREYIRPKRPCPCLYCESRVAVAQPVPIASRPPAFRRPSHDLFQCLESTEKYCLPESTAKIIFGQLVNAVLYLDMQGMTHNDIKDENVIIDEFYRIKLIDFGGATLRDPTLPAPFMAGFYGTKDFAAPEIRHKMVYQTPPAEIWALGLLLVYMVTGIKPFEENEKEIITSGIRLKVPEGVNLSLELIDIIYRCMQMDPAKRITIEELANHPWLDGWREDFAEVERTRVPRPDRDASLLRELRRQEAADNTRTAFSRWPQSFADIPKPEPAPANVDIGLGDGGDISSDSGSDFEWF